MNPELQRNLWLELTPRRMTQMGVVLVLIILTANATPILPVMDVAQYLFYAIVVVWGARDAAQAVVGEIRDRTWDSQRLSALTPFEMTWGKLLGATSYAWFGGLICLLVIVGAGLGDRSSLVLPSVIHYLGIGLLAQAVSMFASLIAVRRRQTRTRFNVFQYQAAGVMAGVFAYQGWESVTPNASGVIRVDDVMWWGATFDGLSFYLASLCIFLGWTLIGCYRLMRLELQVQNLPTVWLAFILFMAIYTAGFGDGPLVASLPTLDDTVALRLVMANATLAGLTYIAVLFEPKDRVLYRWLGEMMRKGRSDLALSRLQCWMIAYAATIVFGLVLMSHLGTAGSSSAVLTIPMVVAAMGFLTRDLGVFLFFGLAPEQKRGDMPAVVTLGVLYLLLPSLLRGAGIVEPAILLYPLPGAGLVGAAWAWLEAAVIWFLVIRLRGKQTAALPQT